MKSSVFRKLKAGDLIFSSHTLPTANIKANSIRVYINVAVRSLQLFTSPKIYTNGYDSLSCIHLLYCDKSHYQNFTRLSTSRIMAVG